jgi:hypothetical protein
MTQECAKANFVVTQGTCQGGFLQTWYTNSSGWVYWQLQAAYDWVIVFWAPSGHDWVTQNPKWFYSPPTWNVNQSLVVPGAFLIQPDHHEGYVVIDANSLPTDKMLYTTATFNQ